MSMEIFTKPACEHSRTDKLEMFVDVLAKELYRSLEAWMLAMRERGDTEAEEKLLSRMDQVWEMLGPEAREEMNKA